MLYVKQMLSYVKNLITQGLQKKFGNILFLFRTSKA